MLSSHLSWISRRRALKLEMFFTFLVIGSIEIGLKIHITEILGSLRGPQMFSTATSAGVIAFVVLVAFHGSLFTPLRKFAFKDIRRSWGLSLAITGIAACSGTTNAPLWFLTIATHSVNSQAAMAATNHRCLGDKQHYLVTRAFGSLGYGAAGIAKEFLSPLVMLILGTASFLFARTILTPSTEKHQGTQANNPQLAIGIAPERISPSLMLLLLAAFAMPFTTRIWDSYGIVFLNRFYNTSWLSLMILIEVGVLFVGESLAKLPRVRRYLVLLAPAGWMVTYLALYFDARTSVYSVAIAMTGISFNCVGQSALQLFLPIQRHLSTPSRRSVDLMQAATAAGVGCSLFLLTLVTPTSASQLSASLWAVGIWSTASVVFITVPIVAMFPHREELEASSTAHQR